jgi:hypothetical protein
MVVGLTVSERLTASDLIWAPRNAILKRDKRTLE